MPVSKKQTCSEAARGTNPPCSASRGGRRGRCPRRTRLFHAPIGKQTANLKESKHMSKVLTQGHGKVQLWWAHRHGCAVLGHGGGLGLLSIVQSNRSSSRVSQHRLPRAVSAFDGGSAASLLNLCQGLTRNPPRNSVFSRPRGLPRVSGCAHCLLSCQ